MGAQDMYFAEATERIEGILAAEKRAAEDAEARRI